MFRRTRISCRRESDADTHKSGGVHPFHLLPVQLSDIGEDPQSVDQCELLQADHGRSLQALSLFKKDVGREIKLFQLRGDGSDNQHRTFAVPDVI